MAVTRQEVAQLYVATFNRAPDAAGLDYWINDSGLTLDEMANSFFAQPETQALYPNPPADYAAFVNDIYQNLFNRDAEKAGLDYWVGELENGNVTVGSAILAIVTGAQDSGVSSDATILANKTEVGLAYADAGLGAPIEDAYEVMKDVDYSQESVDDALKMIDDIAENAGDSFELTTGIDTIVGTSLNDTIEASLSTDTGANITSTLQSSDTIDGGAGDDVLNVTIENTNINNRSNNGHGVALDMQNVETLKVDNLDFYHGSSSVDFLLDRVEGLETIEVGGFGGEDAFWLTPNIVDLDLKDAIETDVLIDYRNGVLAGDDDSMNISVEGSSADVIVGQYNDSDVALENVNVDFIGNSSIYGSYNYLGLYAEGLENVTVTDDGAMTALEAWNELDIMGADKTLKTVDASAATGNLSMDMGTEATDTDSELVVTGSEGMNDIDIDVYSRGTSAEQSQKVKTVTVNTGSSNDYINIDTNSSDDFATLTANVNTGAGDDTTVLSVDWSEIDTINVNYAGGTGNDSVEFNSNNSDVEHVNITADGGEGEDTIALRQQATFEFQAIMEDPVATEGKISLNNFETLEITDQLTNAFYNNTDTLDLSKFGATNVSLDEGEDASQGVTIEGLTSGSTVSFFADAGDEMLTLEMADSANDVLNIVAGNTSTEELKIGFTNAQAETINITSNDKGTAVPPVKNTVMIEAEDLTTVTVDGNAGLELVINAVTTSLVTDVDASAATGNIDLTDVTYSATASHTITTGSGEDILKATAQIDTMTGGAGEDHFVFTNGQDSQGTKIDTITDFVSGTDSIDFSAFANDVVYQGEVDNYGAVLTALSTTSANAVFDTSTSTLYVDINKDGILDDNDLALDLDGVTTLTQDDFIV